MQKYILPTSFLGMNFLNLSNVIKNKAAIVALEQQGVLHDFWKSFNIKSSWKERTSKRSFYDCNWTQAYNHLVHKQTIKHFVKLVFIFCFYFHFHFFFLIKSHTRFRVNPHSIVAWMSSNSLLEADAKSEV